MSYRLAIFDFDGTLADSYPWFADQFNAVATRFGCRAVSAEEIEAMRGLHTRQIMARIGLSSWRLPAVMRHVRTLIAVDAERIPLFDGIAPMLLDLRAAGVRLAVASSNSEATVRTVLGPTLQAQIEHFSCGLSMFGKKAHFRQLRRRCRLAPHEVICIGDELRDAEAARAAGLDFGAVSWGYTHAEALAAQATRLFTTPAQIATVLAGSSEGVRVRAVS